MNTVVRRGGIADVNAVAVLFDAYRTFYGQPSNVESAREFLTNRLRQSESVIFLVETPYACVGFVQLFPSHSSVSMKPVWILNDLFVSAENRRSGIATQLIQAAVQFARECGAARLDLATATDNAAAQALYEKLGWKQDSAFAHYKCTF